MAKYGLKAIFHLKAADTYVVSVPANMTPKALVAALNAEPGVHDAALDGTGQATTIPNDYFFDSGTQWWLGAPSGGHHDDLPGAWSSTLGTGIYMSILDSGISFTHPELYPKLLSNGQGGYIWYNEVTPGVLPQDSGDGGRYPHGTFVSGIAGAATNNSIGIAGMAPNAALIPIKVFVQQTDGRNTLPSIQTLYNGIMHGYQVSLSARVLNYSGINNPDPSLETAITAATNANSLFVAASGNTGDWSIYYPANYWNVMDVGASNYTDQRQDYSTVGYNVSVLAPSGDGPNSGFTNELLSTYTSTATGDYYSGGGWGTSFSAPQVTGLAALLAARFNTMTSFDLRYRIEDTADNIDHVILNGSDYRDQYMGWGRINANRATQATQPLSYYINAPSNAGFSIPAWPTNLSLSNSQDIPTLFPGVTASVYWWDPKASGGAGNYVSYSNAGFYSPSGDGLVVPRFGPGRGYEVSTSGNAIYNSSTVAYPFNKVNHLAVCHLNPGWNLIGTPNSQPIAWNTTTFRVRRPNRANNSQIVTENNLGSFYDEPLSQAAAERVIEPYAWTFDRQTVIQQNPAPGVLTQIQPMNAYWVDVNGQDDLELLIPAS